MKELTFKTGKVVKLCEDLYAPIPDGFKPATSEKGENANWKTIIPSGCSENENHIDLKPLSFGVQSTPITKFDVDRFNEGVMRFVVNSLFQNGVFEEDKELKQTRNNTCSSFYQVTYDKEHSLWSKVRGIILVNFTFYQFHIYANYDAGEDYSDREEEFENLCDTWLSKISAFENSEGIDSDELSFAVATEELYPHYKHKMELDNLSAAGATVIGISSGTDYQFITFRDALKNTFDDGEKETIEEVIANDDEKYTLSDKAKEMQSIFRVDSSAFNKGHDRECEIAEGYLHKAYMFSALRSFAWTLGTYCDKKGCNVEDLDVTECENIVRFISLRKWLNYIADSYCPALCSGSDLHVYYIPDSVDSSTKEHFMPSEEDVSRVERMKATFPQYNEILPSVVSLNQLRRDLEFIYPAIYKLWSKLSENRDFTKELDGDIADVVYTWCSVANAAKEPFFSEDGPTRCFFTQINGNRGNNKTKRSKSSNVPSAKKDTPATTTSTKTDLSNGRTIEVVQLTEKSTGVEINSGTFIAYRGELKNIVLPQGITSISGEVIFDEVTTLVIPDGITEIAKGTFDCEAERIILPTTLKTIDDDAFSMAGELKELIIPDGVRRVGDISNTTLEYIYFPSSVEEIGTVNVSEDCIIQVEKNSNADDYFRNDYLCRNNKIVNNKPKKYGNPKIVIVEDKSINTNNANSTLNSGVESSSNEVKTIEVLKLKKKDLEIKYDMVYEYKGTEKNIAIPSGITHISNNVFAFNRCIESVVLPNSIIGIAEYSFAYSSLSYIKFSERLVLIEQGAFQFAENIKEVVLPNKVEAIFEDAFLGCSGLQYMYIPPKVSSIGLGCFDGLDKCVFHVKKGSKAEQFLRDHYPNYQVVYAKPAEFGNEPKISYIDTAASTKLSTQITNLSDTEKAKIIASKINSENEWVINNGKVVRFRNDFVDKVVIPGGVTTIGQNVFKFKNISSIIIPEGVTIIDSYAFADSKIKTIVFPNSLLEIGFRSFEKCENLESIVIPDGVKIINRSAFDGCSSIRKISLPQSIENFELSFKDFPHLEEVRLPNNINKLESFAFNGCVSLKSIFLPESLTEIGDYAFVDCTSLENIVLPSKLKKLGKSAFSGCTSLKRIIIPEGITKIPDRCFYGCSSLEEINLSSRLTSLEEGSFNSCKSLKNISLPVGLKIIGKRVFADCSSIKRLIIPNTVVSIGDCYIYDSGIREVFMPESAKEFGLGMDASYDFDTTVHLTKESAYLSSNSLKIHQNYSYESREYMNLVTGYSVESLRNKADTFLKKQLFAKAKLHYKAILEISTCDIDAMMGLLLSDLKVSSQEELAECDKPFIENPYYKGLIAVADQETKQKLITINKNISEKIELRRQETVYCNAKNLMAQDDFSKAQSAFLSIPTYKDSNELAQECRTKAREMEQRKTYDYAVKCMENEEFDKAQSVFLRISTYKDSNELAQECRTKAREMEQRKTYDYAVKCIENGEYDKALQQLNQILDYRDARELKDKCELNIADNKMCSVITEKEIVLESLHKGFLAKARNKSKIETLREELRELEQECKRKGYSRSTKMIKQILDKF